ncbi:hypothetical protein GCM10022206_57060 [Streptomyces chiangmaiensis]
MLGRPGSTPAAREGSQSGRRGAGATRGPSVVPAYARLIPSHTAIGVDAPVLLLATRPVRGFSTGGEYASASPFIAEDAPAKRRACFGSRLEFDTPAGYTARRRRHGARRRTPLLRSADILPHWLISSDMTPHPVIFIRETS